MLDLYKSKHFKKGFLALSFLFCILFSSFVLGDIPTIRLNDSINTEDLPLIHFTINDTGSKVIEGANYSINVNRSNYWDELDTPVDISLGDLNDAESSIVGYGFTKLSNITQNFIQGLGFYTKTEIDNLNSTWEDNTNDTVDSSELDNLCGVDGQILLRTDGTWGCTDLPSGGSSGDHLNYTKLIHDNVIELQFQIE